MKFSPWIQGLALAASLGLSQAHAAPLPITGGITSVQLTAAPTLTSLGLTVSPLGSAQVSPGSNGIPIAYFPVTGGSIDTASFAGVIQHAGSGLQLTSASTNVTLTNFSIDTAGLVLSGAVAAGGTPVGTVPLFNLGLSGNITAPFSLNLTSAAAGALSAVFGIPNLTGATLGLANTIPITSAVPEPGTALAMLAGLGLMGVSLRRRRAPATVG